MTGYGEDVAQVHEDIAQHARKCSPGLLEILRPHVPDGLVVDLGCGSGHWARDLLDAGYEVLGVDISRPLVQLAKRRAPEATFRCQSFLKFKLPKCDAVTAIGEIVNYRLDSSNAREPLLDYFGRVYDSLRSGGLLIFDFAEPGRHPQPRQFVMRGDDWVCCGEILEDTTTETVTRNIDTFRKVGGRYRRSSEVHELNLYRATDLAAELRRIGFRVRILRGYGEFRFRPAYNAYAAIVARKPLRLDAS